VTTPETESRPVRILFGVTAGAAILAGGLPQLTPDRYDWIGAAVGLGGLALAAGLTRATEKKVTPNEAVGARILPSGKVVAGEGSDIETGAPVDVTPTQPGNYVA
jgi:hypothetical protein